MSNANVPAIIKPPASDLYRALKLAEELTERVRFHSYGINELKNDGDISDYRLDEIFKDLLISESGFDLAKRAIDVAKQEIQKKIASKILEQF